LQKAFQRNGPQVTPIVFVSTEEIKGIGLKAVDVNRNEWQLGSYRLLKDFGNEQRHDLYLIKNNELAGWVDMKDEVRLEAKEVIGQLKLKGYETILLSGDRKKNVKALPQNWELVRCTASSCLTIK
jgi:Cu+-exporting ATPase